MMWCEVFRVTYSRPLFMRKVDPLDRYISNHIEYSMWMNHDTIPFTDHPGWVTDSTDAQIYPSGITILCLSCVAMIRVSCLLVKSPHPMIPRNRGGSAVAAHPVLLLSAPPPRHSPRRAPPPGRFFAPVERHDAFVRPSS